MPARLTLHPSWDDKPEDPPQVTFEWIPDPNTMIRRKLVTRTKPQSVKPTPILTQPPVKRVAPPAPPVPENSPYRIFRSVRGKPVFVASSDNVSLIKLFLFAHFPSQEGITITGPGDEDYEEPMALEQWLEENSYPRTK